MPCLHVGQRRQAGRQMGAFADALCECSARAPAADSPWCLACHAQVCFWDWQLGAKSLQFHSGHHNNVRARMAGCSLRCGQEDAGSPGRCWPGLRRGCQRRVSRSFETVGLAAAPCHSALARLLPLACALTTPSVLCPGPRPLQVFQARIMPQSANSTVVTCAADGLVRLPAASHGAKGVYAGQCRLRAGMCPLGRPPSTADGPAAHAGLLAAACHRGPCRRAQEVAGAALTSGAVSQPRLGWHIHPTAAPHVPPWSRRCVWRTCPRALAAALWRRAAWQPTVAGPTSCPWSPTARTASCRAARMARWGHVWEGRAAARPCGDWIGDSAGIVAVGLLVVKPSAEICTRPGFLPFDLLSEPAALTQLALARHPNPTLFPCRAVLPTHFHLPPPPHTAPP